MSPPTSPMLGVLGGGQLGRMFVHAAQVHGFRVAVLEPDAASPAPRSAAMIWAAVRVRFGPSTRSSAEASRNPVPAAASDNAASAARPVRPSTWPSAATSSSGPARK